jgi:signal transduction histidine kinase
MSSSFDTPRVRRRTVTLTHDKVLKDIPCDSETRVIRGTPTQIDYQDPFLGNSSAPTPNPGQNSVLERSASPSQGGATVLVINASQDMAQEITVELSRTLPGCSILFAPTLSLALWMLKRRSIDIILSSATLPDGPLTKLHESLELLSPPPELVILSDLSTTRSDLHSHPGYRFVELRRVPTQRAYASASTTPTMQIASLGADLRNDLNNPLQEIVAMAFVATASEGLSPIAEEALSAIQRAATNMASVVNSLEDKIRSVVDSPRRPLSLKQ